MEDGERLGDNSHVNSGMERQSSTVSEKNHQNVDSSPHVPAPKSPARLPERQDQMMVDNNRGGDSPLALVPETRIGSDNTHHQNQLQDVETHSHQELVTPKPNERNVREIKNVMNDTEMTAYDESGSFSEREAFMRELETFYSDRSLEFKPPKFYGVPLNCLKLWRAVIRLGGYDVVTTSKLWRQVGESFHPPKTCTTVSWTFRIFYEKALLEYEKYKRENGELQLPVGPFHQSSIMDKETTVFQVPGSGSGSGSGRARRDAAARAMQGWHAQHLLGYGEVAEPVIKDKNFNSTPKREKNLKNIGVINKQRTPSGLEHVDKASNIEGDRQSVAAVMDVGPPADWVKINVRETKDCFEVYALVPGLLREEVRVQSDPVGRLVITCLPEHIDNPWAITPFKKVVKLPARIDPHLTSAVASLHGRLFVRAFPLRRELCKLPPPLSRKSLGFSIRFLSKELRFVELAGHCYVMSEIDLARWIS